MYQVRSLRVCGSCGSTIPPSALFCQSCGERAPETEGQRRRRIMFERTALIYRFRAQEARLSVVVAKYAKDLSITPLSEVNAELEKLDRCRDEIERNAAEEADLVTQRLAATGKL
jgi:predicted nucleic acid-binding Zn ribbon protein